MAATNENRSETRSLYGIPHFHYDFIARIIPGLVLLGMLALALAETGSWSEETWTKLEKLQNWPLGVLLIVAVLVLAYLAGHASDIFTWMLTNRFACWQARLLYGASHNKWRQDKRKCVADCQKHPEYVWIGKAQVESRAFANLVVLLFWYLVVVTVRAVLDGPAATTIGQAFSTRWCIVCLVPSVACWLFLFGSYTRQGRVVFGVHTLTSDSGEASRGPRGCSGRIIALLAVWALVLVGLVLTLALIAPRGPSAP